MPQPLHGPSHRSRLRNRGIPHAASSAPGGTVAAAPYAVGLEHGIVLPRLLLAAVHHRFPARVMNVAVMAVITLLILPEKSLPVGRRVAQAAAGDARSPASPIRARRRAA